MFLLVLAFKEPQFWTEVFHIKKFKLKNLVRDGLVAFGPTS